MRIKCEQVWPEISNYFEGDVDGNLRAALETHFRECKRCQAVLDGTRNVMLLYGDERMVEAPLGFSHRLQRRLQEHEQPNRRSFLGWTAAASLLVTGSFEVARLSAFNSPDVRSQHAQPGSRVPPEMVVIAPWMRANPLANPG